MTHKITWVSHMNHCHCDQRSVVDDDTLSGVTWDMCDVHPETVTSTLASIWPSQPQPWPLGLSVQVYSETVCTTVHSVHHPASVTSRHNHQNHFKSYIGSLGSKMYFEFLKYLCFKRSNLDVAMLSITYKTNFESGDQFSTLPVMPGCLKLPSKFMLKILNITASITQ